MGRQECAMKCCLVGVALLVASTMAMVVNMEESAQMSAYESASLAVMSKLGLREVQEQVDKDLWEARQAQSSADDEDAEIARLLAEPEGLDTEKQAAEKEAKQKEIEAKEATADKLKKLQEEAAAAMSKAKMAAEEYQNAVTAGMA